MKPQNRYEAPNAYFFLGTNCSTITCEGLQAGGINIPPIASPSNFNHYMRPAMTSSYIKSLANTKNMKVIKICVFAFIAAFLLAGYVKLNLAVSYKYEVDLMETNIKTDNPKNKTADERLKQMLSRKEEILHQQEIADILFWLFLLGLILSISFLIRHSVASNRANLN